jgi:transcriptional regulator with XRE-family HTH domain
MRDNPQDVPGYNRLPPLPGEVDYGAVFARRLRQLRTAMKITQRQVAEQMGGHGFQMHQTTIAKIETGERAVQLDEAAAIAKVLGVSLQDLITELPSDELSEALAHLANCQEQLEAARADQAKAEAAAEDAGRRVRDARSELMRAERRARAARGEEVDFWS